MEMLVFSLIFFGGTALGLVLGLWIMKIRQKASLSQIEFYQKQLSEQERKEKDLTQKISQQFENLANRIFDEKTTKFSDLSQKSLAILLDPLREKLKDFEQKVENTYSQERAERGVLRGELGKLLELNQIMSKEANNLTRALKGESKTQGHWGELILDNILERSGLRKNEEYTVQGIDMDLKNEEGLRQQPDVIVHLPGNKHIIVDSKVSLKAFEASISASTAEEKEKQAKAHIRSLEEHIQSLSQKKYHLLSTLVSPDFVILFMPLEPAFALAFQYKPDIFSQAWEKNIAIVSPTTLLTTLRTVSALWKQERQQKNALEIARRGGLLYEKFAGLVKDFNDMGQKIESSLQAHTEIKKKLSEGRGNLMTQVEDLKELGAKTERTMPDLVETKLISN
ncbi:MAG: DNA recombination protein RmuC [Bdellovibrionota bacterium]